MKGTGGKAINLTKGCLGRSIPKARLGERAMTAKAYSQLPMLNRKARRAQAKARKMMGAA